MGQIKNFNPFDRLSNKISFMNRILKSELDFTVILYEGGSREPAKAKTSVIQGFPDSRWSWKKQRLVVKASHVVEEQIVN